MNTKNIKEVIRKKLMNENILGPLANKTFEEYDVNKSGFIEKEELEVILKEIYKTLNLAPPSNEEVNQELNRLDYDKDGRLNLEEYRELIKDLIQYTVNQL